MRIDGSIEKAPVLVVIGITDQGHKVVLALQSGDKESASTRRELFKDLKQRGLRSETIMFGIKLTEAWKAYVNTTSVKMLGSQSGREKLGSILSATQTGEANLRRAALSEEIFKNFSKTEVVLETLDKLEETFYWSRGDYKLQLFVSMKGPNKAFSKFWNFTLTQRDEDLLRQNCALFIKQACEFVVPYSFTYAKYKVAP